MDVELDEIGIVNNLHHLLLEQTHHTIDMTFINTMSSLSLNIQDKFEPIEPNETYYDYDRTNYNTDTDTYADTHANTHIYVESQIETNSEIITETISDEIDESEDFHEYDCYDGGYIGDDSEPNDSILNDSILNDSIPNDSIPNDEAILLDIYDTCPYICFGIPNKYCQNYFDDEDFIYNRYDITNDIKKYIKINNSIDEYTSNFCIGNGIIVDYTNNNDNPDIIYAKILYIYNYINYYYKDLKELKPIERINHLPDALIYWVDNILTIFKTIFNNESFISESFLSIEDVYFKELCYGLKIITIQLQLLLNHYRSHSLWKMEEKHIKTFFRIVNNMCVIIIFMKLNNRT